MNMIWKKAFNDFWATKSKTILALFALFIGAWGLSVIVYTYYISKKDLHDNYMQTNPASVIVKVDSLSNNMLAEINDLPYVAQAEIRQTGIARVWTKNNQWLPVWIFASPHFNNRKINTFTLEEGNYPGNGDMLIERDGLQYLTDHKLKIQIKNNEEVLLNMSGKVHDPGLPPSHMDHIIWGYVNTETYQQLFKADTTAQLLITFAENRFDIAAIQKNTDKLLQWFATRGATVKQSIIPPPGKHPHEGQLQSLLFLQLGIGLLAVLLSCVLLINVISSIITNQIKQIGIMKATGASYAQIVRMYLAGVVALAILAIVIALPLGYNTAIAYNKFIANELNFNVINTSIPFWINSILISVLIILPVLTALLPINKAGKMTVKDALNHEKINTSSDKLRAGGKLNLPLWMKVAFGNVFRNKWGSVLTIFNLMLGLALFSIGLNLKTSIENTFVTTLQKQKYDFSIALENPYAVSEVASVVTQIPEVEKAEYWLSGRMAFVNKGVVGNAFGITAFDDNTQLVEFNVIEGKLPVNWNNSVVVNPAFIDKHPDIMVGDSAVFLSAGKLHTWYISGVVKEIGSAGAYTSRSNWEKISGTKQLTSDIKIKPKPGISGLDLTALILSIENKLKEKGVGISGSMNQTEFMQILNDHISVITSFLIAMAILVLIVGCIGIISIMNINIMERKREIGIMRAMGGSKFQISKIIFAEIFLLGLLSWLIGWLISVPLSKVLSNFFGKLIIDTELDFAIAPSGVLITFLVVVFILLLSGIIPIRNATKIPVHKALSEN